MQIAKSIITIGSGNVKHFLKKSKLFGRRFDEKGHAPKKQRMTL